MTKLKLIMLTYKNLFSKIKKNLFEILVLLLEVYKSKSLLGIWGNFFMNTRIKQHNGNGQDTAKMKF